MKNLLAIALLILTSQVFSKANKSLYQFSIKDTSGEELSFKNYKGKVILFVNIATRCGYTGQLDELEKLYSQFKDNGLIVVGIPSNDFGGQTPEDDKNVAKFCRLKYGANFPITTKLIVKGGDKSPLANYIVSKSGGEEISWNFEKFLFSKDGKFIKRYKSAIKPQSNELVNEIKKAL